MLENLTLQNPYWLVISTICIVFICYTYFSKTSTQYNFLFLSDIQKIYKKHTFFYILFFIVIGCITFIFGIILSQPMIEFEKEKIKKNGIDIQIVFDTSYSMIAEDIKPSRIEVAKNVVSNFVTALEADRVGVVLFAGKPFSSVPLSFDYTFLQSFFSDISVQTIDQDIAHLTGTAIGDALVLAADNLIQDNIEREKIVILMTDGEANKGLDPILALKYLKDKNIKTYTIGVGKDENTFIDIIDRVGFRQKVQIGGVDEETLLKIAHETGGKYYRADSESALDDIFSDIGKLEKKEIEVEKIVLQKPKDREFLLFLMALYAIMLFLIFRKRILL